jgi:hypothetical protein
MALALTSAEAPEARSGVPPCESQLVRVLEDTVRAGLGPWTPNDRPTPEFQEIITVSGQTKKVTWLTTEKQPRFHRKPPVKGPQSAQHDEIS